MSPRHLPPPSKVERADGTGSDERLPARAKDLIDLYATSWSSDGRQFLLTEVSPGSAGVQCAIEQMAIDRPSDVKILVKNEFCNDYAAVSPDGRWMAYESTVSGRPEIYVERYPELGSRQQISTGGGHRPLWSRDSRELFFVTLSDLRQMFAVPVQSGTTRSRGVHRCCSNSMRWHRLRAGSGRTTSPPMDGSYIRAAQEETGSGTAPTLILVQNGLEELKRLVPAK